MPQSATIEDIKAYQEKVEKNKISSSELKPCPRCNLDPLNFKIHAHRERRFLLVIEMFVKTIYCTLVRFRCDGCGKTLTFYPDFAIPYKHYTRQTILNFSNAYIEDDQKTYQDSAMTENGTPEYLESGRTLAPSTIHRWITTLASFFMAYHKESAEPVPLGRVGNDHPHLEIPRKKYRSFKRQERLLMCRRFFEVVLICENKLSPSLK